MSYTKFGPDLINSWPYPGGEIGVRYVGAVPPRLMARVHNTTELMTLLMYLEAARGQLHEVFIPYMPYARQDRVAKEGDPNAIKLLARMLAATGHQDFSTLDLHSRRGQLEFTYAGLLLNNKNPFPYLMDYIKKLNLNRNDEICFVAPDKGAWHRAQEMAKLVENVLGLPTYAQGCKKERDPETGQLSKFSVDESLSSGDVDDATVLILVDDICDGGRTFIGAYKALRQQFVHQDMHLWTTHGIYSNGTADLLNYFATLGTTDSFLSDSVLAASDRHIVINL